MDKKIRSRDALRVRGLPTTTTTKLRFASGSRMIPKVVSGFRTRSCATKREAERRKAHAVHCPRHTSKRRRLTTVPRAARKRAKPGRARLPALRRGTRQTGRSRLTQLQNHVSWNGAEAGVLPASRLSSPAGSPQTGPIAGRVVSRSRPGAGCA